MTLTNSLSGLLASKNDCRVCTSIQSHPDFGGVVLPHFTHHFSGVFIFGLSPGHVENAVLQPFVGPGGDLLNSWLSLWGLSRSSVFIDNLIACHPPHDLPPTPPQITACNYWFQRQLPILIQHGLHLIISLGSAASSAALHRRISTFSKLAFVPVRFAHYTVLPVHHPGEALRNDGVLDIVQCPSNVALVRSLAHKEQPCPTL